MHAISLLDVEKLLDKVVGFRPTQADLDVIERSEKVTGKNRSDLLRACFYRSIAAVVAHVESQREQQRSEFEQSLEAVLKLSEVAKAAAAAPEVAKPDSRPYKISRKPKKIAV